MMAWIFTFELMAKQDALLPQVVHSGGLKT